MAVFFVVKGAMPGYGCTPCILELKTAFRDMVVRSFCVSRFTVNKKAPKGSNSHRFTVAPQLFRDLVVRSPCVSFHPLTCRDGE